MSESAPLDQQIQKVLEQSKHSGWRQYARLTVGNESITALLRYEIVTALFGSCPGALGYVLRRIAYRSLFKSIGRGVVVGRNVTIRGASRIRIGRGVAIDDNVVLDARDVGGSIELGDGVLISRNTIIRARNGRIVIGAGSDIGANCLLATDSRLEIGSDVLVAAYSYLCAGGNHDYSRNDVPIIKQGFVSKGGCVVEDDVWIGSHTTVLDGVRIGTGSIIGSHSLVSKSIEPLSLAWGAPAEKRKSR